MQQRMLGGTELPVSVLGFGCGAVGGLMTRGTAADQERAVARALDLGITYFDTAASYGDGASEIALGQALRSLNANPIIGTKVRIPEDAPHLGRAVIDGLEASLARLGRDSVDLFQLHNPITAIGKRPDLTAHHVLAEIIPAMEQLREAGKIRFWGITAIGDTIPIRTVIDAAVIHAAQVPFNLLNPSAVTGVPEGFPGQDMGQIMQRAQAVDVGVIGIRILAAGALSADPWRHALAAQNVAPIASGSDYDEDLARARLLLPLVAEGHAASLVEAAIRFAITPPAMSTALIGLATLDQLETAAAAALKGPLPMETLQRLGELQTGFVK